MSTQTKSVDEMTSAELEQMLNARRQKEQKEKEAKRQAYESERDIVVDELINGALGLNEGLIAFKSAIHQIFDEHQVKLSEYGGIRSNSKGGFSLIHSSGEFKVSRVRSTQPVWDERSQKAVELIGDFLKDTVKKRDKKLFEILMDFIQKNEKGQLEYAKVMHLFKHKDKYNDPRWVKGLDLIQESYSVNLRGYGYDFYRKDKEGKWERIDINFSSI